jgi:hypothetical protein
MQTKMLFFNCYYQNNLAEKEKTFASGLGLMPPKFH